ncbi:hypothetical protein NDU88_006720 [Pleurodeles waltl]|uniref:Uncharacterized protein n=1 Tax=Pleurodeles waltl TaxID=8319 RepID=A0AAV7L6L8_PLEWA|nr:hypothetical protein NDU88_006720 [Pleurodeles waltl]
MEPSGLWAVRRGHPQRPQYGQTLVQNGALRAVSRQARAPTETPVWAVSLQARAPRETPVWAARRGHPQRPRYGQMLVQNGALWAVSLQARAPIETLRPRDGQTLVQNGAVSCQARAPTETSVWAVSRQARALTETPVRAVSRQMRAPTETLVWAVSRQARAPTETPVRAVSRQARAPETPVRTDTCTEWRPLGCQPSGEGTHRDPGTDRHLYRMEPSGLSAFRRGHPQRPWYGQTLV